MDDEVPSFLRHRISSKAIVLPKIALACMGLKEMRKGRGREQGRGGGVGGAGRRASGNEGLVERGQ